jgi:hypothetical protein
MHIVSIISFGVITTFARTFSYLIVMERGRHVLRRALRRSELERDVREGSLGDVRRVFELVSW